MKHRFLLSLALLVFAFAAAPVARAAGYYNPPGQLVGGKTESEWSRAWWLWATSFKLADSPVADRTGERCGAGQQGPVWFLAGTYGSGLTERSCAVPEGRFVFFPLINIIAFDVDCTGCVCSLRSATESMDDPDSLFVELDGRKVTGLVVHRVNSDGCFDVRGTMAAADGYYAMLRPMPPGKHVLKFGGQVEDIAQLVSYTLTVR